MAECPVRAMAGLQTQPSIPGAVGKEGNFIARGTQKGKGIAVFTSGGDSQGKSN
jgi:hypothetical protein